MKTLALLIALSFPTGAYAQWGLKANNYNPYAALQARTSYNYRHYRAPARYYRAPVYRAPTRYYTAPSYGYDSYGGGTYLERARATDALEDISDNLKALRWGF